MHCKFCSIATGRQGAAGPSLMSSSEEAFLVALQKQGIDTAVACQVDMPFWPGRLDCYHMPSKTAMQIDGSSHFVPAFYCKPYHKLQLSLRCCRAAWLSKHRLLRVHYKHTQYAAAAVAAIDLPHSRFVMVTREYESVQVCWGGISKTYVEWLYGLLLGAHSYVDPTSNSIIFY